MAVVFMIALFFTALFLIVLVLVQRGKGGGLSGAFGGMGGQSAFGTKAGDAFTKITIITATLWILLCVVSVRLLSTDKGGLNLGANAPAGEQAEGVPGEESAPAPSGGGGTDGGEAPAPSSE